MIEIMLAYIFRKLNNPGDGSGLEINPEVFNKTLASDGAVQDYFGISVAISSDGSIIIVGVPGDDDKDINAGSVCIFIKQTNGSYLETQKLLASDGEANEWFGTSVAISSDGSIIIVGVYSDDDKGVNSGSAYIFKRQSNGSYLQTQKLTASDGAASDYFGYSVAISSTSVVIGAYNHLNKGAVYIY